MAQNSALKPVFQVFVGALLAAPWPMCWKAFRFISSLGLAAAAWDKLDRSNLSWLPGSRARKTPGPPSLGRQAQGYFLALPRGALLFPPPEGLPVPLGQPHDRLERHVIAAAAAWLEPGGVGAPRGC